jgi:hypothetical protein
MKTCTQCQQELPFDQFYPHSRGRDGYMSWCKSCCRAHEVATRNPERKKNEKLRRLYGISLEDFRQMESSQNFGCAVCGADDKPLVVDHSHDTGLVRALLCGPCNMALGLLKENPERIRGLALYAEAHKGESRRRVSADLTMPV